MVKVGLEESMRVYEEEVEVVVEVVVEVEVVIEVVVEVEGEYDCKVSGVDLWQSRMLTLTTLLLTLVFGFFLCPI